MKWWIYAVIILLIGLSITLAIIFRPRYITNTASIQYYDQDGNVITTQSNEVKVKIIK